MCGCVRRIRFSRIYNSLLRTLMLIAFGLANMNSGLTPHVNKDSSTHDLNRDINQNLIMSGSHQATDIASSSHIVAKNHQLTKEATRILLNNANDRLHQHHSQYQHQHSSSSSSSRSISANNIIDTNTEDTINNSNNNGGTSVIADGSGEDIFKTPMFFGTQNSTIVTTQIGATAHIPCTIHHIGDGVVSWIRKKDYHLLTVGLTTYSSDERFSATHLKHSEDWTLQIKFVQLRDAGVYECQVSTHPPTSIFLHLDVVEARAEISGPPIRYLTPGSTLRLQCRVVQNTVASEYIFWYHDNRMINYDIDRGINVSTEADFQSSELTILKTRREHSGNFTCVASNTQPASVLVHIFKGDNPAAMYHGHVGSSTKSYQTHLHSIMAIISIGYSIFLTYLHLKVV